MFFQLPYVTIDSHKIGVIFCTYAGLISDTKVKSATFKTRFEQMLNWCGSDFDGCIIFDECHKAKNLYSESGQILKTGTTVDELQRMLPNAWIVYSSATGASELKDMAYMTRLGLWGKDTVFEDFETFKSSIEKR